MIRFPSLTSPRFAARFAQGASLCLALSMAGTFVGCGGSKPKGPDTVAELPKTVDGDPVALFPGGALAFARVDIAAMKSAGATGTKLSQLADQYLSLGEGAGFVPSRDADTAYIGSYSLQGIDVLGALVGRFDEAKLKKVADEKTELKSGGQLTATPYLFDQGCWVYGAHGEGGLGGHRRCGASLARSGAGSGNSCAQH
jgi:hypothetical protein